MGRYHWDMLNKQQVGAYAEYFVKMELTMCGLQVYRTEVDDRGIDFVARYAKGRFLQIQVKSLRKSGYVFLQKDKFDIEEPDLYVAFVYLTAGKTPDGYLIPATVWKTPNSVFVDRPYGGDLKSKPEWGINLSAKNFQELEPYRMDKVLTATIESAG